MKIAKALCVLPIVACSPLEKRQSGTPDFSQILEGLGGLLGGNKAGASGADLLSGLLSGDLDKMMANIDINALLSGPIGDFASSMMDKITSNPSVLKNVGNMLTSFIPAQKMIKKEVSAGKLRPGVSKTMKVIYGPYVLKAANDTTKLGNSPSLDPKGTAYIYAVAPDFPRDITILKSKTQMVDEQYKAINTADGLYNHHNLFFDIGSMQPPAVTCEPKRFGFVFSAGLFAGGATGEGPLYFTSDDGKFNSGFYVGKDSPLVVITDTVNNNNVQRTVYTETEFEYIDGKPEGLMGTMNQVVDLGMCGATGLSNGQTGFLLKFPPGQQKFAINSTGIVFSRDGYVVRSKGHMHDGGEFVRAKLNGKEVCLSQLEYTGTTQGMDGLQMASLGETTDCVDLFAVKKGDKLELSAYFDLVAHPSRRSGHDSGHQSMAEQMALYVMMFADPSSTPAANASLTSVS